MDTRNFTRSRVPSFPYERAAKAVLPGWDISLVFAGETRAKQLNKALRGKDYVPNVLSYESGKKSGEIIICLTEAKRQAPSHDMKYPAFVGYLFIHGLFHLAGARHGTTMERKERALLARLINIPFTNVPTHRHRH
ncbi:MAG TPA: rRNA maturation RNase YbeY [Candidatus Paceibacterota bacterium]|nr:rRNA maturation RNase YbeY [Candidatus Paceibacterota bacterium]